MNPKRHNPNKFTYIVHAIPEVWDIATFKMMGKSFLEGHLLQRKENILELPYVSTSLN